MPVKIAWIIAELAVPASRRTKLGGKTICSRKADVSVDGVSIPKFTILFASLVTKIPAVFANGGPVNLSKVGLSSTRRP
jgi:hypothetical protein